MAWFDVLGGIGAGLEKATGTALSLAEQKKQEARQAKLDALQAAQEKREQTRFETQMAADVYDSYNVGDEIDLTSDDGKLLANRYKRGLGKGTDPTKAVILETRERKNQRLADQKLQYDLDAAERTAGMQQFLTNLTKPFQDAMQDPAKLETLTKTTTPMLRQTVGQALGGDPNMFLTDAERLRFIRLTPGYQQMLGQEAGATSRAVIAAEAAGLRAAPDSLDVQKALDAAVENDPTVKAAYSGLQAAQRGGAKREIAEAEQKYQAAVQQARRSAGQNFRAMGYAVPTVVAEPTQTMPNPYRQ